MMRNIFIRSLIAVALVLPAAASTASVQHSASASKGVRGKAVVSASCPEKPAATVPGRGDVIAATLAKPDAAATRPKPAKTPWLVVTPRLPEAQDGTLERRSGTSGTSGTSQMTPVIGYAQGAPRGYAAQPQQLPLVQALPQPAAASPTLQAARNSVSMIRGRLARVTAYWACEGDYYTRHGIAATGVHLHDGHCAVDPTIIPYGSIVNVAGVGSFLAVDTGSAVVSRVAARQGGHTSAERSAIVVDLYFANRLAGERFASRDAKWVSVNWFTPGSQATQARQARSLFAEEDWTKIQGKQL